MRLPVQIAVWTLLMVALLGPHSSWLICLTGNCSPRIETIAKSCCSCCSHEDAGDSRESDRQKGDGENGGDTCPGCCIDLAMAIDEGPMPQPIRAPDQDHEVVAVLPEPVLAASSAFAARFARHDTGPPRVDRRTALIATTILRE